VALGTRQLGLSRDSIGIFGADTAEVSLALRMAISMEGVECQPK